jgi:hypothetical protein
LKKELKNKQKELTRQQNSFHSNMVKKNENLKLKIGNYQNNIQLLEQEKTIKYIIKNNFEIYNKNYSRKGLKNNLDKDIKLNISANKLIKKNINLHNNNKSVSAVNLLKDSVGKKNPSINGLHKIESQ